MVFQTKVRKARETGTRRFLGLKIRTCENSFGYHRDKIIILNFITGQLLNRIRGKRLQVKATYSNITTVYTLIHTRTTEIKSQH